MDAVNKAGRGIPAESQIFCQGNFTVDQRMAQHDRYISRSLKAKIWRVSAPAPIEVKSWLPWGRQCISAKKASRKAGGPIGDPPVGSGILNILIISSKLQYLIPLKIQFPVPLASSHRDLFNGATLEPPRTSLRSRGWPSL